MHICSTTMHLMVAHCIVSQSKGPGKVPLTRPHHLQVRETSRVPEDVLPGPHQGGGGLPGPQDQDGGRGGPRLQVRAVVNIYCTYCTVHQYV
jgi:hypothetical protein